MNQRMSRIAALTQAARRGEGKGGHLAFYQVLRDERTGGVQVAYRGTVVAAFNSHSVVLNSGGWRTPTTKAVMNAALAGTPWAVYQEDWDWYVWRWDTRNHIQPFEDHMTLEIEEAAS